MNDKQEYDFYGMGKRYAKEQLLDLRAMAKKIGEEYGEDAQLMFESGMAEIIPQYSRMDDIIDNREIRPEGATSHFADDKKINNSYLGGNGTSSKYSRTIIDPTVGMIGKYNEPKDKDDEEKSPHR